MASLYEIQEQYIAVMVQAEEMAAENDGEINDYMSDLLDAVEEERNTKIGNICRFYKSLNAESKMVKAEADSLAKRAKSLASKADSLKKYLASVLEEGEKYADSTSKVSWRKSESVQVNVEAELLPAECRRIKCEADKTEIKKALKSGVEIEGCSIVVNQSLSIK